MKKRSTILLLTLTITMVMAAFLAGKASASTACFNDTNGHWAEVFICWAKDNGITTGTAPGVYSPDEYVTRAQMAVFLNKTATLNRATGTQFDNIFGSAVAINTSGTFASVTITAPAQGALLVNGSLNLYCSSGILGTCNKSTGNTYINVDGTRYNRQYYSIDGGTSSANGAAWNSSNTAYIPVAAGVHTVYIEVANNSSSAGVTGVYSGGINVLFVPFAGDGTTPVIPPVAPEPSSQPETTQGN